MNVYQSGLASVGDSQPRAPMWRMSHTRDGISIDYDGIPSRLWLEADVSASRDGAPRRRMRDAMIDTGAERSLLPRSIANELGAERGDTVLLSTVTGSEFVPTYLVDLHLCEGVSLHGLEVLTYPDWNDRTDLVLGMDVISRGKLVVCRLCGSLRMELTFPTSAPLRSSHGTSA